MGAVAAGLILATALRLGASLRHSPLGLPWCGVLLVATVAMVAWLRLPLWWAVLGLGALGMTVAWRGLERRTRTHAPDAGG
jgi:chromate transporter